MKKRNGRTARIVKDAKRLVNLRDVMYYIGNFMYRKSFKYTLVVASASTASAASKQLGLPGLTATQAVFLSVGLGATLLSGGLTLKYVPTLISAGLITTATANDLNLMEDYKKSEVQGELGVLWERVFKYESELRYTDEERLKEKNQIIKQISHIKDSMVQCFDKETMNFLGVADEKSLDDIVNALSYEKPLTNCMERTEEGFKISAMYALEKSIPQARQRKQIGFCLGLLEDWLDGSYFHSNDVKLIEQYNANSVLCAIKKELGFGKLKAITQVPERMSQKIWFNLVTRTIAVSVGNEVNYMNKKYNTDLFNAQTLLWPGEENEEWLNQFEGAKEEILAKRKLIIHKAFGSTYSNACGMIERMFLPNFKFATELRKMYDPEYVTGGLEYNIINDLYSEDCSPEYIQKHKKYVEKAKTEIDSFLGYLKANKCDLFSFDKQEELRAVKIAYHTNKNNLKRKFQYKNHEAIKEEVRKAVRDKDVYSRRLVALRLHHQLSMLELKGYRRLVKDLGYTN